MNTIELCDYALSQLYIEQVNSLPKLTARKERILGRQIELGRYVTSVLESLEM